MKNNKIASENTIRWSLLKTLFLDQSIKFILILLPTKRDRPQAIEFNE